MSFRRLGLTVERLAPERWDDFLSLHSEANGAGWCRCVAWWVPTWEDWGDRSQAENTALRSELCKRGENDGLLAYSGNEPVGWCQLGPRDRLRKLVAQFGREPDDLVWAVTCFLVAPAWRRRGVATTLLDAAVSTARDAGAELLEGYPRVGTDELGEMWTGSSGLFEQAGFVVVGRGERRSVVSRAL